MGILDVQNDYLKREGVKNRGPAFQKLANALRLLGAGAQDPPLTELEVLELLGFPDYGASDERGAEFAYTCGDQFYLIQIGPDGIVRHVGSASGDAADLTGLPRWHPYSWIFEPSAGSGYLGIELAPRELRPGDQSGMLVAGVAPGSPASRSSLKPKDLILAIDDTPVGIGGMRAFREQVAALRPGKTIALRILRPGASGRGSIETVKMTVGEFATTRTAP